MKETEFKALPVYLENTRPYNDKKTGYTSTGKIVTWGEVLHLKNDAQRQARAEYVGNGKTAYYRHLKSYCPAIVPSASDMTNETKPSWDNWEYVAKKRVYRHDNNVVFSGLLCLDYDNIDGADCQGLIDKLFEAGALACSISLSGCGVAALFEYDKKLVHNRLEYAALYEAAADYINSKSGLAADLHDASCKNASRLRFLSGNDWQFNEHNSRLPKLNFTVKEKPVAVSNGADCFEQSLYEFCSYYGKKDAAGNIHFLQCPFCDNHTGTETPEQCTAVLWLPSAEFPEGGFSCRHDSCQGHTIKNVKLWAMKLGWLPDWQNMVYQGLPVESRSQAVNMLYRAFTARYRFFDDKMVELKTGNIICKSQRADVLHQTSIKYKDEKGKDKPLTLAEVMKEKSSLPLYVKLVDKVDLPAKIITQSKEQLGDDHCQAVYNIRNKYLLEQAGEPLPVEHYQQLMNWIRTRFISEDEWQYYLNWITKAVEPFISDVKWDKNQTAIFFQGGQGTGKSTLAEDIPTALLGTRGMAKCTGASDQLFSNGFENCPFALLNEQPIAKKEDNLPNILKGLITEYITDARYLYKGRETRPAYCNVLSISNELAAINCENGDRRWSVFSIDNLECPLTGWVSSQVQGVTVEQSFPEWLREIKTVRTPEYAKGLYYALKAQIYKTFNVKVPLITDFKKSVMVQNASRSGYERWLVEQLMLNPSKGATLTTINEWTKASANYKDFNPSQVRNRVLSQKDVLWTQKSIRVGDTSRRMWVLTQEAIDNYSLDSDEKEEEAEDDLDFPF